MTALVASARRANPTLPRAKPVGLFAFADWPLYLFVASIPFETLGSVYGNGNGLNTTVSWVLSAVWAVSCLLRGRMMLVPRGDRSIVPTALFIVCIAARGLFVDSSLWPEVTQLVLTLAEMTIMLWLLIISARVRPRLYESVAWVYGLSCAVLAILEIVGVTSSGFGQDNRLSGLGENPNTLGGKLAIGLVLLVGLAWNRKRKSFWITLLVGATWPFSIFTIMQTGSRGALASLCVGLLVLTYSRTLVYGKPLSRITSSILATALAGLVIYSISESDIVVSRWRRVVEVGDMATREIVYPRVAELIYDNPFVGVGPSQNYRAVGAVCGSLSPRSTENTLLWSLTSVGLLGSLPFFYVLYLALRSAWRLRYTSLRWTPIAALMTTLSVASAIEWYHVKVFWLLLAISIGGAQHLRANKTPKGVRVRMVLAVSPARQ